MYFIQANSHWKILTCLKMGFFLLELQKIYTKHLCMLCYGNVNRKKILLVLFPHGLINSECQWKCEKKMLAWPIELVYVVSYSMRWWLWMKTIACLLTVIWLNLSERKKGGLLYTPLFSLTQIESNPCVSTSLKKWTDNIWQTCTCTC